MTAEFVSNRTGLASVAVSSRSKRLGTWRISDYTPEFRETSGVGRRPVLTPDEVLRLPVDEALILIRGKKALKVDKMDYSRHPEYPLLHSCKASAHVPEWRRLEMEAKERRKAECGPALQPAKEKASRKTVSKAREIPDKKEASRPSGPAGVVPMDKDSIMS